MIVITKVEFLEVDQNPTVYKTYNDIDIPIEDYNSIPSDFEPHIKCEYIHGREFINSDGVRTILGMTEDVSKHLGEPFKVITNLQDSFLALREEMEYCHLSCNKERESWETERNMLYSTKMEIIDKYAELKLKYDTKSVWERIKHVFTK